MKKQTLEEFIAKSKIIFGEALDYSKVEYFNSKVNVTLICKEHGEFIIAPKDHLCYGRGCQICSGAIYNTQSFIEKSVKIHGDKFQYNKSIFNGVKNKLIIICKIHGDFEQTPDKHFRGQGCPKCKKASHKDLSYVIKMGTLIHNGKYDYSKSVFTKMFEKITIICPDHGEFNQTPANHINQRQGCAACMVGKSKKEAEWLDMLNIPNDYSHRTVILHLDSKRLIVDGYDPTTNTVYEFYGDFWHGNPKVYNSNKLNELLDVKFGVLYQKTMNREDFLIKQGLKIISIWENDFDNLQTKLDRRGR